MVTANPDNIAKHHFTLSSNILDERKVKRQYRILKPASSPQYEYSLALLYNIIAGKYQYDFNKLG